jgi:chemotaxis protein CheC
MKPAALLRWNRNNDGDFARKLGRQIIVQPNLTTTQLNLLRMVFERGTEAASQALSKWLGHDICLTMSVVNEVELAQTELLLGPPESLVAACSMGLTGWLTGLVLLVFRDSSGLALSDLLLHQAIGTAQEWGELEESAAKETTNIVGCAYVNALASHLPRPPAATSKADREVDKPGKPTEGDLVPTPPTFVHEFAGSLLEFAFMEQAMELDQVLVIRSELKAAGTGLNLDWTLLYIPSRASRQALLESLLALESHRS